MYTIPGNVDLSTAYIYIAAWSDDAAKQGLMATFTDGTNIVSTGLVNGGTGPQWEVYAGLSDADSRGFGWLEAVHPDDRELTRSRWERAQRSGEYYVEHRIRRAADGQYRWHQTRAKPAGESSTEWVGTSADVHEMRGLQDRQQVLLLELQHRTRNLLDETSA